MNKLYLILLFFILTISCHRVNDKINPHVSYAVEESYLNSMTTSFPSLSYEEKRQDWAKEYLIAEAFARDLDFYRAISTFMRAKILTPSSKMERILQTDYSIVLCYYLSEKYSDAVESFEKSGLSQVEKTFPAYKDLLLILYDSYNKIGEEKKSQQILNAIEQKYPDMKKKLSLSTALQRGHIHDALYLSEDMEHKEEIQQMICSYSKEKKSVGGAQVLNALLPGAGYLYLGQKKSAFTSLLLNGLFIAASYQFFHKGYTAAGIICVSFEAGWYFSGIYGAGEEAKFYNEQLYEEKAAPLMQQKKLFPIFMVEYTF